MRILLTGANGLVGQKIKKQCLKNKNTELIATSYHEEINPLPGSYTFEKLDITKPEEISNIFSRYKPDILVNAAAEANVNACEKNKMQCWNTNTKAIQFLTDNCNLYKSHFIHISTDFVFDGTKAVYYEDAPPSPVNYYGITKQEAEDYIMNHSQQWTIIRTILVYGFYRGMKKNNLVTWVRKTLKNNQAIRVVNDQYRCPTFAEDLAIGIISVAQKKEKGIFHLAGKEMYSIAEMAYLTAEHFGLDKKLISEVSSAELNEPAPRPLETSFDLLKAEKKLNFKPRSFKQGLKVIEQQINKSEY
jgi:dTDP-4-dehydrorhamnose reductase